MTAAGGTDESVVIRPRGQRIMAAAVALLATVGLVTAFRSGVPTGIGAIGPVLLVVALAWAVLVNPHVAVEASRVRVVNPLRTTLVDFGSLREVRTKWALTLVADDGAGGSTEVIAWSAPAPGGRSVLRLDVDDVARNARARLPRAAVHPDGTVGPADLAGTDSGDAAAAVRARWEVLLESGALDGAPPRAIVRTSNVASIAGVLIGLVLTAGSALL